MAFKVYVSTFNFYSLQKQMVTILAKGACICIHGFLTPNHSAWQTGGDPLGIKKERSGGSAVMEEWN